MFIEILLCFTAEPLKICRGTWFKGAANENGWIPINEEMARAVENSHQAIWRSMVCIAYIKPTFKT